VKPIRPTTLTLPSGAQLDLTFASCPRCRRLVGACSDWNGSHVWDSIGFTQAAKLRFCTHACPPEGRRRDLARDSKLEAHRNDPR
jgi:hypothetical protein